MNGYSKIYNRIGNSPRSVENHQLPDMINQVVRPLGASKAAGRQSGFVNAVEFNLVAALLVFALIIGKVVVG